MRACGNKQRARPARCRPRTAPRADGERKANALLYNPPSARGARGREGGGSSLPMPSPSPVPTPLPTPIPTGRPSPTPSLKPSPMPSPAPTPEPSPVPSQLPTSVPTPLPTPVPTAQPTPSPSPVPSPAPSPMPSPGPSPQPSPVLCRLYLSPLYPRRRFIAQIEAESFQSKSPVFSVEFAIAQS